MYRRRQICNVAAWLPFFPLLLVTSSLALGCTTEILRTPSASALRLWRMFDSSLSSVEMEIFGEKTQVSNGVNFSRFSEHHLSLGKCFCPPIFARKKKTSRGTATMAKHQRVAPHESRCLQCLAFATKKFGPIRWVGFLGLEGMCFWESLLFGECQRVTWMSREGSAGKRLGSVVGITPTYPTCK